MNKSGLSWRVLSLAFFSGVFVLAACSEKTPPITATAKVETPASATITRDEPAPTLAPLGDYRLLEVSLGKSVDAEQRVQKTSDAFAANDIFYLSALGSASSTDLELSVRWSHGDGANGVVIAEAKQAIAAGPASVARFKLASPSAWPPGDYRVDLAINGTNVDHRVFSVR